MSKELTKTNFSLAIGGETAALIAEELGSISEIPFDRVKIPGGGGTAFEIPGDDPDNPDVAKELVGIIVLHHPLNARWDGIFDGQNTAPLCASDDGVVGICADTGERILCESCPHNSFSSAGGKACKNMYNLYILRENECFPILMTLPPTSIKSFKIYLAKQLLMKGIRPQYAVTKITLKKEVNKNGIAYAKAQFSLVGLVPQEMRAELDNYKENLKQMTAPATVAATVAADTGVDDEDYPF